MTPWMTRYPRPQLRRESFLPLLGPWTLNGQPIALPFPPQSPASGYHGPIGDTLRYDTAFTLPQGFLPEGCRLRLHFGAVDQLADVYLNDRPVARHSGGYLPFFADVTDALLPGENHLTVLAIDKLDPLYPYGKQRKRPGGMWYTPVSGIWQTVWLEAVPDKCIEAVRITPDLTGIDLTVESCAAHCDVVVQLDGIEVARGSWTLTGAARRIDIPAEHRLLWTPDTPVLYDVTIHAGRDTVQSYFALRTVDFRKDARGVTRLCLNGQPIFLCGVLDQGYFPQGIFLPESPEAYDADIRRMKALGFNLLRKHIKVEPECFYHACDRLGMLVLQDMVNSGVYNFLLDTAMPTVGLPPLPRPAPKAQKAFFRQHVRDTMAHLHSHPCIIGWTLFNEGWGQHDTEALYRMMKALDPTRFVDAASGWFAPRETDVDSVHIYFRNKKLHPGKRPMLLSECGGYTRAIEGHLHQPGGHYGYGKTDSAQQLTAAIRRMYEEMVLPAIPAGLFGAIYTQLSDVEGEINGLYTYDRAVCKVDEAALPDILSMALHELNKATQA